MQNFWNLVEQAGPLRWPILVVLGIGLALVVAKLYDLLRDRSVSRSLADLDLRVISLDELTRHLHDQRESMLASLQSAMVNVFRNRPSDGMLHDEIANFVGSQQDHFASFRRRLDFLADTAGALGLMGTVWGMFTVFFQGTSDRDVILRGMGIALITTLLGLVVSIILNLCATELSTFFDRRLAMIARTSDGLRFRLLELAAAAGRAAPPPVEARAPVAPPVRAHPNGDRRTVWCYLEPGQAAYTIGAGGTVPDVTLGARDTAGNPASGVGVGITLIPGAGTFGSGERDLQLETDAAGRIQFAWIAPPAAGSYAFEASVQGQPGSSRRVVLQVEPGVPERLETEGNHQAAVAGMRLPMPIGVKVLDRFDNPVPDQPVTFAIANGDGRFATPGNTAVIRTTADGTARTPFVVSSAPGPNAIRASLDGGVADIEFTVFGTEM